VQLEQPQVAPQQTALDEVAEKMLDQFFEAGRAFPIERVAQSLGLVRSMADYHMDTLTKAGLLESNWMQPQGGTFYVLTSRGRAHVVARRKT
jgi:predicted ArsR family transcriptional regulator